MTQALYAHMNNKKKKKRISDNRRKTLSETTVKKNTFQVAFNVRNR
jgi:hypothetical protein